MARLAIRNLAVSINNEKILVQGDWLMMMMMARMATQTLPTLFIIKNSPECWSEWTNWPLFPTLLIYLKKFPDPVWSSGGGTTVAQRSQPSHPELRGAAEPAKSSRASGPVQTDSQWWCILFPFTIYLFEKKSQQVPPVCTLQGASSAHCSLQVLLLLSLHGALPLHSWQVIFQMLQMMLPGTPYESSRPYVPVQHDFYIINLLHGAIYNLFHLLSIGNCVNDF